MTALTVPAVLLVLLGWTTRLGFPAALALAGATPSGAALAFGSRVAIPTFDFVAVLGAAGFVLAAFRRIRQRRIERFDPEPVPGLLALILFCIWCIVVTLLAPLLFSGTAVISATGRLDAAAFLSVSNLAQLGYLILGVFVVALVARDPSTTSTVVGIAGAAPTLLSFWALLGQQFHLPFPTGLFDNSPVFTYIALAPGGAPRFRGILSEPAALAGASLTTIAFFLAYLPRARRRGVVFSIVIIAMAVINGIVSTSATFVVAGIALAVIAVVVLAARIILHRVLVRPATVLLGFAVAAAAFVALPLLAGLVQQTIDAKVGSSSYTDRSGSDAFSYGLVVRTFGFGVGVGSNRPSSFLSSLLSTTGIVGTALFVLAVALVLIPALRIEKVRPVVWTMIALLVVKGTSGPDLSDPTGLTWLCLGVLAHAVLSARVSAREAPRLLAASPLR